MFGFDRARRIEQKLDFLLQTQRKMMSTLTEAVERMRRANTLLEGFKIRDDALKAQIVELQKSENLTDAEKASLAELNAELGKTEQHLAAIQEGTPAANINPTQPG